MKPYLIPIDYIDKFVLTEDGGHKYVDYVDIFEMIESANKSYKLDCFTSLSRQNKNIPLDTEKALTSFMSNGIDFIPVYIGQIDSIGHKFGADIDSIAPYLMNTDNLLHRYFDLAKQYGYAFMVLGDHGMIPIRYKVNIAQEIQSLKLKPNIDYIMFLDSTVARFWIISKSCRTEIFNKLSEFNEYGRIIDKSNYMDYRIPLDIYSSPSIPLYGDVLWYANPGVIISPDFFHTRDEDIRGMHGYINDSNIHSFGQSVLFYDNIIPYKIEQMELSSVCEQISGILDISTPNKDFRRKVIL